MYPCLQTEVIIINSRPENCNVCLDALHGYPTFPVAGTESQFSVPDKSYLFLLQLYACI